MTLDMVLKRHQEKFEKEDRVEIRGTQNNNLFKVDFNVSLKILISDNFKNFFQLVGPDVFSLLLENTILLTKEHNFYIQLNQKSLANLMEKKKPEAKKTNQNSYKSIS